METTRIYRWRYQNLNQPSEAAMDNHPSLFDRYLAYIKNNRYLAVILIFGTVLMAISSFTGAVQQIINAMSHSSKSAALSLNGKWQSPLLANAYAPDKKYTLVFDFIQQNDTLLGTVTETNTAGVKTRSLVRGIVDGKLKDHTLSFYTQGQTALGSEIQPYKDLYNGIVKDDKIEFVRQNDLPSGGIPTKFTADFIKPSRD
jgi:hypothetical protein